MHRPEDRLVACIAHTDGLDQQIVESIGQGIGMSGCLLIEWGCWPSWSERREVRWMGLGEQSDHN